MATSLPAASYLSNSGRTVAEMKAALDAQRNFIANMIGGGARSSVTISSGNITPADGASGGWVIVDTEGAASADDLANIVTTNLPDGGFLYISIANAARVVTVKNNAGGSGQIQLVDSADFVMNATDMWLLVQRRSTDIFEIDRGYGSSFQTLHDHLRIASVPAHNTLCPHSRLRIDYASASTVTVAADSVVLSDSGSRLKRFASLSETLNVANTGANGRDVVDNGGAEQASAWYHLWAIGKDDGTLDSFATQACYPGSATSIFTRLPSGYTWAGYIGAARNDASSNLVEFYQRGDEVIRASVAALSAGTATIYTSIDLSGIVPQTARRVMGNGYLLATSGTPAGNFCIRPAAANQVGEVCWFCPFTTTGNGAGSPLEVPLSIAQTIYYHKSGAVNVTINVSGWRF